MENNFLSLIKTRRSVRVYKSEPVPAEALDAVLEAGLMHYGGRTSIPYHHCNHRPQIPAGNRQVKRRSDGEQYRPLLWRACRDFGSGRWLRKHLCRGWKLRP